jgi:superfamily I DNA and/or RNA helicase
LCFIPKIRRRSLDASAFVDFDRNPNFVLDDILPDVVARLRNQGKWSPCRMDFVRDKIIDHLMKQ